MCPSCSTLAAGFGLLALGLLGAPAAAGLGLGALALRLLAGLFLLLALALLGNGPLAGRLGLALLLRLRPPPIRMRPLLVLPRPRLRRLALARGIGLLALLRLLLGGALLRLLLLGALGGLLAGLRLGRGALASGGFVAALCHGWHGEKTKKPCQRRTPARSPRQIAVHGASSPRKNNRRMTDSECRDNSGRRVDRRAVATSRPPPLSRLAAAG
jgi:hypothetical protein